MQSRGLMTSFTQHNNYNIKSINRAIRVNFQLTKETWSANSSSANTNCIQYYCKESSISDTDLLRYPFSSELIKSRLIL